MSRGGIAIRLFASCAVALLACGGSGQRGLACPPCPSSMVCVDDPKDACDASSELCAGLCVATSPQCGGMAGLRCPQGMTCVDDPRDDCDPKAGGADCSGLCAPQ
ncbi:MAG: hypothetical protein E6J58_12465 [Deltaproteobacteria bacterium]|nr:MAG: hypothetical protein E6J58_12465 [Deltaproteobacteria bacterium]